MPMDIAIEQNVSTLQCFSHHHFSGAIFGALLHTRSDPLPIQIESTERGPIVTYQDSVRVEHWYDLEHKVVSQISCNLVV